MNLTAGTTFRAGVQKISQRLLRNQNKELENIQKALYKEDARGNEVQRVN